MPLLRSPHHGNTATHALLLAALGMLASRGLAQESPAPASLHERIDRQLSASAVGPVAGLAGDEEFVRRIYLDLTGAVPSVTEARAFLADTAANKRPALIDRLLDSPSYARHMATTLDVTLTERRPDKHVKREEWLQYLYDSFTANKPWNKLAGELLGADGSAEKNPVAAKFYLDREVEPNLLTRDVGRMFFGMDLGCCQCHDHPLIDSYLQYDYYGLYAFFNRGSLFTAPDKKVYFAEKAEGDVKFTSVFTKKQDEMRPRLPGDYELAEPVFVKGEEYTVAPADKVRAIPKYSRTARLAELIAAGENRQFQRNIVNRLWAVMLGRGLVEPLDMHHADNLPAQPELLEMLATEFAAMKFDMRGFLREIALSETYQRSSRSPAAVAEAVQAAEKQQPELAAADKQLEETLTQVAAAADAKRAEYDRARQAVTGVLTEFNTANEAVAAAIKAANDLAKSLAEAQQQLATKVDIHNAVQAAAAKSAEAAAKLPDEKALAQAVQIFQARAAQLAAELPAAEKLVQDRTPPATEAAGKLTAAKQATTPLVAKLQTAQQQASELQRALAQLDAQLRQQRIAAQAVRVRLSAARSFSEIAAALAAAEASRKKVMEIESQLQTGKLTMTALAAQLPQFDAALAVARTAHNEATGQQSAAQVQFESRQQAAQLLAETAAKAELVVQKLPNEEPLKQAAEALRVRRDQLAAEVPPLQKVAGERAETVKATAEKLTAAQAAMDSARTQLEQLQKSLPELEAQLPGAAAQAATDGSAAQVALGRADAAAVRQFQVAGLDPLTPEQMAWSILKTTGVVDQQLPAAEAEVNKTLPIDPQAPPDPARIADRARRIEQFVQDKLKGQVATFIALFGHAGGQPQRDFFATADQALFFANGGVLQSWLSPNGDNLVGRLSKLTEPRAVATELYLALLTRAPADDEVAAVTSYLEGRTGDRNVALQEMAWALITSNEFRFQ